jgi:TonB family protein
MYPSCEGFVAALLLPTVLDTVPAFLAGIAWKATVMLLAAFASTWLLRRASASLRHLVWSAAFVCLLVLPLASLALPGWSIALPAGPEVAWNAASGVVHEPVSSLASPAATPHPNTTGDIVGESGLPPFSVTLFAIWMSGCCLVAGRLWIGVSRVRKMARDAEELGSSDWTNAAAQLTGLLPLRRSVPLLRSERVSIPMTAGFRRPLILLPKDAQEWTAERRQVVLAHELLHVQRADYGWWMLARIACAVYWFHPLAWLAAAQLRREAEQACDDGVLRLGAQASAYAEHLVSLARGWSLARTAELSAMAMAQSSHLESRIRALLDPARNRRELSRRSRLCVAVAAVLILAPLAAINARAQAATASLQGTVSDISGARLPGAFITVQRPADQSKAVAVANDAGEFTFGSLPAGEYVVEIRNPGFQLKQQKLQLTGGSHESLDVTLEMGSVVESLVIMGKSSAAERPRPSGPPRRIRVGGNVQRSKLITEIKPVYPKELQREGVQGMVVLEAVILTDGSLGNLRLANNLTQVDQRLVDAAMEAIRFWRYEPTLLNGVPVEVVTTITLDFRLEH